MSARLRWKRVPPSTGLRAMVEPKFHRYHDGVETYATVQSLCMPGRGWFWYGLGENTSHTPVATADDAKVQAEAHVKAVLARRARLAGVQGDVAMANPCIDCVEGRGMTCCETNGGKSGCAQGRDCPNRPVSTPEQAMSWVVRFAIAATVAACVAAVLYSRGTP